MRDQCVLYVILSTSHAISSNSGTYLRFQCFTGSHFLIKTQNPNDEVIIINDESRKAAAKADETVETESGPSRTRNVKVWVCKRSWWWRWRWWWALFRQHPNWSSARTMCPWLTIIQPNLSMIWNDFYYWCCVSHTSVFVCYRVSTQFTTQKNVFLTSYQGGGGERERESEEKRGFFSPKIVLSLPPFLQSPSSPQTSKLLPITTTKLCVID